MIDNGRLVQKIGTQGLEDSLQCQDILGVGNRCEKHIHSVLVRDTNDLYVSSDKWSRLDEFEFDDGHIVILQPELLKDGFGVGRFLQLSKAEGLEKMLLFRGIH